MTGSKKALLEKAMVEKVAGIETGCGCCCAWGALVFNKTKQARGGRVRFGVTGGAPISNETLHFVMCAMVPVVQNYGRPRPPR